MLVQLEQTIIEVSIIKFPILAARFFYWFWITVELLVAPIRLKLAKFPRRSSRDNTRNLLWVLLKISTLKRNVITRKTFEGF